MKAIVGMPTSVVAFAVNIHTKGDGFDATGTAAGDARPPEPCPLCPPGSPGHAHGDVPFPNRATRRKARQMAANAAGRRKRC